ncbi:MAG: ribonuclease III domain-containing protein [Clostridia bacterium]|nr:ribonuclease III domain-containing protein [Clostridia bacterium]
MTIPGSLELAYIGDCVYDLYVRSRLITKGEKVRDMHLRAIKQVCAHAQSEALKRIKDELTGEEAAVVKRARNAHQTPPKNASIAEYHMATAIEALIGYLYLNGQVDRIDELMNKALDGLD